jgi:EpsI family protein
MTPETTAAPVEAPGTSRRDSAATVVDRRAFLIGGAMALTGAAAYAATPRRAEHRLARVRLGELIPQQIGDWRFVSREGIVVARADEAQPADGYDQVLSRLYAAPGLPAIMLLIAYGSTQGGSLQLHRPETCYPGQGFRLSDFSEPDLAVGGPRPVAARRFVATRDDRIERLIYWTRIADSFPRNTAGEYAAILSSVVRGVIPEGVLVRVSTIGSDIAASDAAIDRFIGAMVGSLGAQGRSILLGSD